MNQVKKVSQGYASELEQAAKEATIRWVRSRKDDIARLAVEIAQYESKLENELVDGSWTRASEMLGWLVGTIEQKSATNPTGLAYVQRCLMEVEMLHRHDLIEK